MRNDLDTTIALTGIVIVGRKRTNLAYAPEIAGTMLSRQRTEAIIAARL